MEFCRSRVVSDIEKTQPEFIFGFGGVPLSWAGRSGIGTWRGRYFPLQVGNHKLWYFAFHHPAFLLHLQHQNNGRPSNFELSFKLDMERAFKIVEDGLPEPVIHSVEDAKAGITTITGREQNALSTVVDFLKEAAKSEICGLDYETQGLRPYGRDAAILTIAVALPDRCLSFALDHPQAGWSATDRIVIKDEFKKFLLAPVRKCVHSLHFEMEWSAFFFGREIAYRSHGNRFPWEDSLTQAFILDERKEGFSLDFLAHLYFGINIKKITGNLNKNNMREEPLMRLLPYNCLMKGTRVVTDTGPMLIEEIVRNRLPVKVLAMNETTKDFGWYEVKGWHKTTAPDDQQWVEISIEGRKNTIRCTPDHEIITTKGRKQAVDITTGDEVFTDELEWHEDFVGALCGTLLGDSTIASTKNKAYIQCGNRNEELIKLKQSLFGGKISERFATGGFKDGYNYLWWMPANLQTKSLRDVTYIDEQRFARPLLDKLTSWGMALWYMDDGFQQKDTSPYCCFSVHRYSDKEAITEWFSQRYGKASLSKNGRINLGVNASKKLCAEIAPYMVPSLRYKLPYPEEDPPKPNLPKRTTGKLVPAKILSALPFHYTGVLHKHGFNNRRYCLTIPETGNFMTLGGLVSNCIDAKYHLLVYQTQDRLLEQQGLQAAYQEKLRQVPTCVLTQLAGLPVDYDENVRQQHEMRRKIEAIETELFMLPAVKEYQHQTGNKFNPGSDKDVKYLIQKILGHYDAATTDKSVLDKLDHPFGKLEINWRHYSKMLSTYIERFNEENAYPDHLYHVSLGTVFTDTGRLNGDFQNVPKRGEEASTRRQIAGKGVFASFDYGQIEARVIACASQDPAYCKATWDGLDVHGYWAKRIAQRYPQTIGGKKYLSDPAAMKKLRDRVKNKFVFPLFFSASLHSVAGYMDIPDDILAPEHDLFWQEYKGVKEWQQTLINGYQQSGYTACLNGRRRRAPLGLGQVVNSLVQGSAADIVMDGMNRLSETCDPLLQPRLQIHDDLLFYFESEEQLQDNVDKIINAMLDIQFPWVIVPLTVEMSIGPNWYEMKEVGTYDSHKLLGLPTRQARFL
jgi:DNA polymerase I-like protein with 3'-5' exonuclease and polymerase domains